MSPKDFPYPVFYGQGFAAGKDALPRTVPAICDATLEQFPDLRFGWYEGSRGRDVPAAVHALIAAVVAATAPAKAGTPRAAKPQGPALSPLQLATGAIGGGPWRHEIWMRDGRAFDAFRPSVDPVGHDSAEDILRLRAAHVAAVRRLLCELDAAGSGLSEFKGFQCLCAPCCRMSCPCPRRGRPGYSGMNRLPRA